MYSVLDLQKLVQMLSFLGISPGSGAPAHSVVLGGGTNAAPGAPGTLLGSNGPTVDPSFLTLAALGIAPLPLPAGSVGTSQIANNAVGAAQLGVNVVGDGQIAWGRILKRVVGSIAALGALNISIYQEAFATDFGHGVGGGGAYSYNASTPSGSANGGSIVAAAGGVGCWILQHNGTVDVFQFGAQGIGAAFDDTPAFAAAVATGLRVHIPKPSAYFYPKTGNIACTTPGQKIFGDGKDISIIQCDTGFNMSATGLFVVSTAGEGPEFSDFQVTYIQPDTSVRASLTTYPVTVYAQSTNRMTMERMKIQQASYIVDLRNNPGGNNFVGCEFSWYNVAINIDGAVDSIKIDRCHFWPFSLTANQQNIFYDVNCIAVNSGRCDDLHIDNCLFINGKQIVTFHSGLGDTFGNVVNTDFDTNTGITMGSGSLNLAGCYFSCGFASQQSIIMTGGSITGVACRFAVGLALSNAQVSIQGGNAIFQMSTSFWELGTADFTAVAQATATTVMLNSCFFDRATNISPGSATINVLGGRATVSNCRTSDKGTGTGNFIAISTDDLHSITGNALMGWGNSLPAGHTQLLYTNNI